MSMGVNNGTLTVGESFGSDAGGSGVGNGSASGMESPGMGGASSSGDSSGASASAGAGEEVPAWKQSYEDLHGRFSKFDDGFNELKGQMGQLMDFVGGVFQGQGQGAGSQEEPDEMSALFNQIGSAVDGRLSQYEQQMQVRQNIDAQTKEIESNPEYKQNMNELLNVLFEFGFSKDTIHLVPVKTMKKALHFAKLDKASKTPAAENPPNMLNGNRTGVGNGKDDVSIIPRDMQQFYHRAKQRRPSLTPEEFMSV